MGIEEAIRITYGQIEKGGWIMATNEKKTKKQEAEKGLIDFLEEATDPNLTVGIRFVEKLNELSGDAKKLYEELKKLGYKGIRFEDFTRMLNIYNTRAKVKKASGEAGY